MLFYILSIVLPWKNQNILVPEEREEAVGFISRFWREKLMDRETPAISMDHFKKQRLLGKDKETVHLLPVFLCARNYLLPFEARSSTSPGF